MTRADLDSESFYNLMQEYRHAPVTDQALVLAKFEAVKSFLLRNADQNPVALSTENVDYMVKLWPGGHLEGGHIIVELQHPYPASFDLNDILRRLQKALWEPDTHPTPAHPGMRGALEQYADEMNWQDNEWVPGRGPAIARAALAGEQPVVDEVLRCEGEAWRQIDGKKIMFASAAAPWVDMSILLPLETVIQKGDRLRVCAWKEGGNEPESR